MSLTAEEQAELDALRRELNPELYDVGAVEAGARGLVQGATLNFADEIAAGARAGMQALTSPDRLLGKRAGDIFSKGYELEVAKSRERDRLAREQNPYAYGTGEVAGNIASAVAVPGVQMAKGTGLLSRLGKTAAASAAEAGLQSYGADTQFDAGNIAMNAGIGGALGGVAGAAFGGPRAAAQTAIEGSKKVAGAVSDYAQGKAQKVAEFGEGLFDEAADVGDLIYGAGRESAEAARKLGVQTAENIADASKANLEKLKNYSSAMSDQFKKAATDAAGVAQEKADEAYMALTSGELDDALRPIAENYGPGVARWIAGESRKSHVNMLLDVIPKKMHNEMTLEATFDDVSHPFYRKTDEVLRDWARRNNMDLNNPSPADLERLQRWSLGDARDTAIREFESGIAKDVRKVRREDVKGAEHSDFSPLTRESEHAEAVQQLLKKYDKKEHEVGKLIDMLRVDLPKAPDGKVLESPTASRADEMIYKNIKKLDPYFEMEQPDAVKLYYRNALDKTMDIERRMAAKDGLPIPQGPKLTDAFMADNPEMVNTLRIMALEDIKSLLKAKNEFVRSTEGKHFVSASMIKPGKQISDKSVFTNSILATMLSGSLSAGAMTAGAQYAYNQIQKRPDTFIRFLNDYKSGRISLSQAAAKAADTLFQGSKEAREKLADYGITKAGLQDQFSKGFEAASGKAAAAGEAVKEGAESFAEAGKRVVAGAKETAQKIGKNAKEAASETADIVAKAGVGAAAAAGDIASDIGAGVKAVSAKIQRAIDVADKVAAFGERYGPKAASALHRSMMQKDPAYREYVERQQNEDIEKMLAKYRE